MGIKRFFRNIGIGRFLANAKGYSIPELLAVLAVMGIFATTAAPNFSKWALRRQLDAEAQKFSLELQLARISAIKNNNDVVVNFNTVTNQYTVHDDTNSDAVVDAGETVKVIPFNPRVSFGFVGGVVDPDGNAADNSVDLAGGGTILTFNSRGEASDSGTMYLIPTSEIGQSNVLLRAVSVVQATGSVDYWSYNEGQTPLWS